MTPPPSFPYTNLMEPTPPPAPPVSIGSTVNLDNTAAAPAGIGESGKFLLMGIGVGILLLFLAVAAYFALGNPRMLKSSIAPAPVVPEQKPAVPKQAPAAAQPANQIPLSVTAPLNNTIMTTPSVKVTGTTLPNAEVSINETDTKADATGKFTATVTLYEGDNPIIINAFDENGQTSETELSVTYQPLGQ